MAQKFEEHAFGQSPRISDTGGRHMGRLASVVPRHGRRPRPSRGPLAAVLLWSLVLAPALVVLLARFADPYGFAAGLMLAWVAWILFFVLVDEVTPYPKRPGHRLAKASVHVSLLLVALGPWPVVWVLHTTAGRTVEARVMEARPVFDAQGDDTGTTTYRCVDASTEEDLGDIAFGPHERAAPGDLLVLSLPPKGWGPAVAAERLEDTFTTVQVNVVLGLASADVVLGAATWAAWPRRPRDATRGRRTGTPRHTA
jgi:hypothetical protein